jgi:hypothetical protein
MKIAQFLVVSSVVAVSCLSPSIYAAPVESVESARASAALQKVDSFLNEKVVVRQLKALGISHEQASARLAQLSEAQLQQLAAHVDLIRAGGTIQKSGEVVTAGPLGCLAKQLGDLFHDFFELLFCWGDLS